jgi:hypothetical protein
MKALFVDVDGVLNSSSGPFRNGLTDLCPERLAILARIIHETGAVCIVSSAWRHYPDRMVRLRAALIDRGIEIGGATPTLWFEPRSREIEKWLSSNAAERYAVLDDGADALLGIPEECAFRTRLEEGLTNETADAIIKHLR